MGYYANKVYRFANNVGDYANKVNHNANKVDHCVNKLAIMDKLLNILFLVQLLQKTPAIVWRSQFPN